MYLFFRLYQIIRTENCKDPMELSNTQLPSSPYRYVMSITKGTQHLSFTYGHALCTEDAYQEKSLEAHNKASQSVGPPPNYGGGRVENWNGSIE